MEIMAVSNETWNFVWQTFANASLTYDLVSSQNGTKGNEDANLPLDNPAKLGILTGLLIACLADFRIATPKLDVCLDSKLKSMTITVLNLVIFLLLAPIVSSILTILFVYRKIVEFALRIKLNEEFAGLLDGTDCVWALEESTALSVINVLAILEINDETTSDDFFRNFRHLIEKCLLSSNIEKLNWLREKKYGYHYWRKMGKISIDERVRCINEDHEKCDGTCEEIYGDYLKNILTRITNEPLPREHSSSWEIIVIKNCCKSSSMLLKKMDEGILGIDENCGHRRTTIPVVFRIHHCLGDGVALLRLFLESIGDSTVSINNEDSRNFKENKFSIPSLRKSSSIVGIVRNEEEIIYNEKNLLTASMPFTMRISLGGIGKIILSYIDDSWKKISMTIEMRDIIMKINAMAWRDFCANILEKGRKRMGKILKIIWIIISIPNCLLQQALRSMDNSALHGPPLKGEKMLSYWIENYANDPREPNIMAKIRDVKNATGSRFGDVVLAALSENLYRYYYTIGEAAPKSLTVVIPARMSLPSKKFSLQNDFSVGLLSLCCSEINGESTKNNAIEENTRLFDRLDDVTRSSEKLRNDPDYLINFWVMKWLSAALPECLLRPILESHSTLVFSNLPGPQEVTIIGQKLRNVAFWIPHRGNTGLGCSFLTYGGKVHVSLVADRALITSQRLLDEILRNTINDIEKLYESISLSCHAIEV